MSDDEIEKPPERRAPSSRASKGNRMGRLIQEEEDEADNEFYQQEFWAEADQDDEYADADDEDGGDSFDSDFGDSTESDSDEDDGEAEKAARSSGAAARKRSVYKDPKASGAMAAPRPKASHKKRPRPEGGLMPPPTFERSSLRGSTKVRAPSPCARREGRVAPSLRPSHAGACGA